MKCAFTSPLLSIVVMSLSLDWYSLSGIMQTDARHVVSKVYIAYHAYHLSPVSFGERRPSPPLLHLIMARVRLKPCVTVSMGITRSGPSSGPPLPSHVLVLAYIPIADLSYSFNT